jgi:hypothetical protein
VPNFVQPTTLPELVKATKRGKPAFMGRVLAVDPGETTGWADFENCELTRAGQFPVRDLEAFDTFVTDHRPDAMVIENYRVYASRAAQHVGSEVNTAQYIGILKFLCGMYQIPLALQMAHQAKGWVSDARLHQLGLFQTGHRHANDAIRHGVYWLLFGHTEKLA